MFTFLMFLFFAPILLFLVIVLVFQFFKLFSRPTLKRNWVPIHRFLPSIEISQNGDIYARNTRDVKYLNEYDWHDRDLFFNKKYNLNDLSKLWILVNPYGFLQSHVILSFQFGDDLTTCSFLTISYEVRKTDLLDYKVYKPIFKRYEGFYLVATEEDAIFLRTNIRKGKPNFLFPIETDREQIRSIFSGLVREINIYSKKAFSYKILNRNCLTEILKHLKDEGVLKYKSYNLLNVPKLIYSNFININSGSHLSYADFLKQHKLNIPESIRADKYYSVAIRQKLAEKNN